MRTAITLAAWAISVIGPLACAQQIPAVDTGPALVTVSVANDQVTMRDAQSQQLILDARGMKLYKWDGPQPLLPAIQVIKQPTGFDAIYRFTNSTTQPQRIGEFAAAVMTLGPEITWRDFRKTCEVQTARSGEAMYYHGYWYPGDLYSPVAVLANSTHTVGVSIQYPVLDYKHDVLVSTCTLPGQYASGEGGMGWMVSFLPSAYARGAPTVRPCMIDPGEERTYVMSVRVTRKPNEWVRTLVPYRNFFRDAYGAVEYERSAAPWAAVGVTDGSWISQTNPSGWAYPTRRPDVHGWGPWIQAIQGELGSYKHVMLWTPSGLYDQNRENNFPFQFTSRWLAHPNVKKAIDPNVGLPRVKSGGQTLGLWWGRSLQVATQWNAAALEAFDPHNPIHVDAALKELELAVKSGATVIGLDTFDPTLTPVWEQIEWLQKMREHAPQMKFVTEPCSSDILHRLTPTLVDAWREPQNPQSPDELYGIRHPNYLADFLLPGHETWAAMHWESWNRFFGHMPSEERMRQDVIDVASWGYVPVIFAKVPNPNQLFRARRSWETSVPADLRLNGPPAGGGGSGSVSPSGGGYAPPGGPPGGFTRGSSRYYDKAELRRAITSAQMPIVGPMPAP